MSDLLDRLLALAEAVHPGDRYGASSCWYETALEAHNEIARLRKAVDDHHVCNVCGHFKGVEEK